MKYNRSTSSIKNNNGVIANFSGCKFCQQVIQMKINFLDLKRQAWIFMSGLKYDKKKSHVNIIKKTGTSGKLCDQQNKTLHKKKTPENGTKTLKLRKRDPIKNSYLRERFEGNLSLSLV